MTDDISQYPNSIIHSLVDLIKILKTLINQFLTALPKNHIFKNLNNVTITPHIAGASVKTAYYAAEVIAKDVRNYIDGKKLVNRIC